MCFMNEGLSRTGRRVFARGQRGGRVATLLALSTAVHASAAGPAFAQAAAQPAPAAAAPARVLTLDDALELVGVRNEQIEIAQAGVRRAVGGERRARSERFPQVTGSASYDRALASEFSGVFDATGPACTPLQVNPLAPIGDRVSEIERALIDCPPSGDLFGGGGDSDDDSSLPFGQRNTYRLGVVFSQVLYAGGRISAQQRQAQLSRVNADWTLKSTQAQLSLDVAQAFFDAALADRLVLIAEESYAQADRAFAQTRAQREAGRQSEFDLLRAQVARDTLQPDVVRQRALRDVAYLRLKQLLDLRLETPIQLTAHLDDETLAPPQRFASSLAEAEAAQPAPAVRTAITQAENDLHSQEAAVTIASSQRKPQVSIGSDLGFVTYPSSVPTFDDWRTNWTLGATVSLPLFTGGRIKADEAIARAGVDEQKARLSLTRELADLDAASVRAELQGARAAWEASAGVIQQAARAYEIAELRYREGLSTQLELSDSRLLLAQAQVNRASAARTLQVIRVRYALLPQLPLSTSAGAGAGSAATAAGGNTGQTQQQTGTAQPAIQGSGTGTAGAASTPRTSGTSGAQP
jgi:outer membrane protein TolC